MYPLYVTVLLLILFFGMKLFQLQSLDTTNQLTKNNGCANVVEIVARVGGYTLQTIHLVNLRVIDSFYRFSLESAQ